MEVRKSIFVSFNTKRNVKEDYKFLKELGSGAYGVVFLAQNKTTSEKRAIKAIAKDRIEDPESFTNEITILRSLDHPNILKLYEVYETESTIYLVTELCEGGELFFHITKKSFLTEEEAAIIMRQIFSAVAYCHENKICHRDLKPENFLLKYEDDIKSIKMIDFGLSKKLKEDEILTQPNGTPFYIAPEILDGKYSWEVDNWSLGVILYILLCGTPPFFGKATKDIVIAIKKGVYTLSHKPFQNCSIEVKDLISKLLVKDPKKRYTSLQAFEHPWVKRQVDEESKNLQVDAEVFENIGRVLDAQSLKKTILLFIATQIPEEEIKVLKSIFVKIDKNGNGLISKDEMLLGMSEFKKNLNLKLTQDQIVKMFDAMDIDKSGQIDYSEFIAAFLDTVVIKQEKYLKEAFQRIDLDKSGKISKSELKTLLGNDTFSLGKLDIDELINQADRDKDGEIDYSEFLKLMKDTKK